MSEDSQQARKRRSFRQTIQRKEERRLRARSEEFRSVWFGLGLFGVVGWSVAIPTLVGVGIGWWIDHRWESRFSWTLMGMFAGVLLGCLTAWNWIHQESRESETRSQQESEKP